jgi:8-hydroxy-5-deazaflavin:NADPH oxidoreductase
MKIGVIGVGNVGARLARFWSQAGHDVMVSGSRDESKLKGVAEDAGAEMGSVGEAAGFGDVVLLAIPWQAAADTLAETGAMAGKVVVDATNNVRSDASPFAAIASHLPDARVVKAFNTVFAAMYDALAASDVRPDMVFCGDDADAKAAVAELIRDTRFEPVDAGGAEQAPAIEHLARLNINIAYAQERGPFVYRFLGSTEL